MNRRTLLGLLAAIPAAGRAQPPPALVFTAIPDQDETRLVERFGRVATYLQAQLGVPVSYLPVKSYPAAVTAFTNNQVQLAWFGGFTGVQARRAVPGSEAIAQGVEDTRFRSFFIANSKLGLARSESVPDGDRRAQLHLRGAGVHLRPGDAGVFHPPSVRQGAGRRCSPASASRATIPGRCSSCSPAATRPGAMDFTVYDLEQKAGRVDPAQVSGRLGDPLLPRLQLDRARRPVDTPVRRWLQGAAARRR